MVASDQINLAAFLAEARRRASPGTTSPSEADLREPLFALLARHKTAPETLEHRVLARLLHSMAEEPRPRAFARSDIAALSPPVLQLLVAFVDDLMSGRYLRAEVRSLLLEHKISTEGELGADSG